MYKRTTLTLPYFLISAAGCCNGNRRGCRSDRSKESQLAISLRLNSNVGGTVAD